MTTPSSDARERGRLRGWLEDLRVYARAAGRAHAAARLLRRPAAAAGARARFRYRLREAGIDRTTIGFLSWVGLAYGFKWVWAPLVDRLPLPLLTRALGRRRSWLLRGAARPDRRGLVGMALHRSRAEPAAAGRLRTAGGLRLGHAGHRARRLSHRVRRALAPGGAWPRPTRSATASAMITASAGALWIAAAFDPDENDLPARPLARRVPVHGGPHGVGIVTVLFSSEPQVAVSPDTVRREQEAAARLHSRPLAWLYSAVVEPVPRLRPALPLAGAAAARADRHLSHLRHRAGRDVQPVLPRHGLHQGRGRRGVRRLRRGDDARRRRAGRRARAALRRDARAHARRGAVARSPTCCSPGWRRAATTCRRWCSRSRPTT